MVVFVSTQDMVFEDGSENLNRNIIWVAFEIYYDFQWVQVNKNSQHTFSCSSSVLWLCFQKYKCLEIVFCYRTSMKCSKVP